MFHRISSWSMVAAASVTAAMALALAGPSGEAAAGQAAQAGHGASAAVVGTQPASGTPSFPLGTPHTEQIRQLAQCGNTMYAVGTFTTIQQGGHTYTRHDAFSFRATAPFTVTSWNPNVNGTADTITFNRGRCADAYIGGNFTKVRGRRALRIAEVRTSAPGSLVRSFRHAANKEVETLASYQNHILAGGFFTRINGSSNPYMTSLNATTGRGDRFLRLRISGFYRFHGAAPNPTRIYNQQISHSQRRDLVEGDFTSVGGKRRQQVFMLNLASRPRATVTRWTSPRFDGSHGYPPHGYYYSCADTDPFYIRSGAWSPDDKTVYLASTGFRPWNFAHGLPLRGLCDTASAFSAGSTATFKWVNYTGCDSLSAVAADSGAAYFAGHERWSQNPNACDRAGTGAIPALGLEGLSPSSGKLLVDGQGASLYSRDRGLGADDMLITRAGLWIASDNFDGAQRCGGVSGLSGICFLPYGA